MPLLMRLTMRLRMLTRGGIGDAWTNGRGGVLGDSQICAGGAKGKVCIKSTQVAALTGMLRTRVWATAAAG